MSTSFLALVDEQNIFHASFVAWDSSERYVSRHIFTNDNFTDGIKRYKTLLRQYFLFNLLQDPSTLFCGEIETKMKNPFLNIIFLTNVLSQNKKYLNKKRKKIKIILTIKLKSE